MFKTDLAREVWESKYRNKDESPIGTFQRVARSLASIEKDPEYWYPRFLKTLVNFSKTNIPVGLKCTSGGRITANIGTSYKKVTLINCFIAAPVSGATISYNRKTENGLIEFPVKYTTDTNPDDLINVFITIAEQAKTLASEGGYGICFDFIRPRGSLIKGIGIEHPGVVAYMKIWDIVSDCIVRGNSDGFTNKIKNYMTEEEFEKFSQKIKKSVRPSAMLASLSVDHPDIEEFIVAKQTAGVLTKFNISVILTDKFMKAVENDEMFELTFKGKLHKRVRAVDLYDLIMKSCYNRAEPGVLFSDNMMKNNPVAYLGKIKTTNPCLHGSSLLLTKNGLVPISDLDGKNVEIWNGSDWSCSDIFNNGIKSVYETRMSNGMVLRSTLDHGVDCNNETVNVEHTLGKSITLMNGADWDNINLSGFNSEELMCLGFAFGDANYHKVSGRYKYVYIGEDDEDVEKIFKNIGEDLEISGRSDKRILSPHFSRKCEMLDFPEVTLPERHLSNRILSLSPLEIKIFLKGLFSANGTVRKPHHRRISLKTSCNKLAEQVQILLMTFGIRSYITSNKSTNVEFENGIYNCKKSYDLNITSDDIFLFANQIGFIQKYKMDRINQIDKNNSGPRRQPKVVSIKYLGEEMVYDFTEPKTHWGFVNGMKVHNCGEIGGLDTITSVCLLGSLNLTQYVKIDQISRIPYFDFDEYTEDIKVFMRMLDNTNDLTYSPLPSYQWVIENLRQVGMGINGLGSTLMMLGIPYNSIEAVKFTEKICSIKENITWQTSAMLAKEKGTFKAYIKDEFEKTEYFLSDRITEETKNLMRKHGVRNAKTTTCPPLGNSSIICDVTSNGIEPVFELEYERKMKVKDWPEGLTSDNIKSTLKYKKENDYEYWYGEYKGINYYYEPHNRGLCKVIVVRDYGYQWLMDNFPMEKNFIETDRYHGVITSKDIEIDDHLNIQWAAQYYNNQSTSKTANLPHNYKFSDFKSLYLKAWKIGLNGFTTYRDGCMESVLSGIAKAEPRQIITKDIKLPDQFLLGAAHIIRKEGKKFYIHFSYLPNDTKMEYPIGLWIYTNVKYKPEELKVCNIASRRLAQLALSCGIDKKIVTESIEKAKNDYPHNRFGRMISLCLRHNIPREDILVALMNIDGDSVSTLLASIRKFLSKTIVDGTVLKNLKCPECGSELITASGCKQCKQCNWSACS